jgi:glycosyltransferase involved in cell wall biosynthesis
VTIPRSLILLAKSPDPDAARKADAGEIPRVEYIDLSRALGATIFDFHDVERSTHPAVVTARKRSRLWGLAMLGIVNRHRFEHVYTTGEDVGIPFGILLRTVRWFGRVTGVIHHGGTTKRRLALRGLGHDIWRNVICLSDRQWQVIVDDIGLPRHKVHRFSQWVDHEFFSGSAARPHSADYVLSCGREARDYPTLQRAAVGTRVKFRVVASGWGPGAGFDPASNIAAASNIEVQHGLPYRELRDAYAGARFVVVPLDNVDYAAGVTGICEAMSMGKAVVVSASPGVADYVRDGVSGLVVPVGDPKALSEAVRSLWDDPARCARMGEYGRHWVETELSVAKYISRVRGLLGVLPPSALRRTAVDHALAIA